MAKGINTIFITIPVEYFIDLESGSEINLIGWGGRTASDIKSGDHWSLEGDITPIAISNGRQWCVVS